MLFQAKKKAWHVQGTAKARVAGGSERRRDRGREGLGRPQRAGKSVIDFDFNCDDKQ